MAVVETTTIRVRRKTQRRLAEEAKLAGTSVIEIVDAAADMLEEQRLLEGMERCYEKHGKAILAEMKDWLNMPGGPPDEETSDAPSSDD